MNPHRPKLAALLERLAQAQRVMLWDAVAGQGLSPTQAQVLLHLAHRPVELRRVGALALEFDLSAPTISDAVASLESKGLIFRTSWEQDRRVQVLDLSELGNEVVGKLEGLDDPLYTALDDLSNHEQTQLQDLLMRLTRSLVRQKVITVARMCLLCEHFRPDAHLGQAARHHCALLNIALAAGELQVDCPDFKAKDRVSSEQKRIPTGH